MTESYEITPQEARSLLAEAGQAIIIDVREPEEHSISKISDSCLIPMRTIPAELGKLDEMADEKTLLVLCHQGVRSLQVVSWLREKGVEQCYSIIGGIDRWSREIDPSVPLY